MTLQEVQSTQRYENVFIDDDADSTAQETVEQLIDSWVELNMKLLFDDNTTADVADILNEQTSLQEALPVAIQNLVACKTREAIQDRVAGD